ncbi:MAG: PKD domain-containing protein, partial [Patescibacteria group bacterium]
MFKKVISVILTLFSLGAFINTAFAQTDDSYLKAVINTSEAVEVKKSIILDASQSFIPETNKKIRYEWDFGDGNKNEGVEVLHVYKQPGYYTATLKVTDGKLESETTKDVFVFRKMIMLITDNTEAEDRIKIIQDFAEKKEVYFFVLDSYGSSTEFISEEILTKKINEDTQALTKAKQIVIWTEENAGLNALSRFIQSNTKNLEEIFSQKTIIILGN